jgi:hypothetical protein
VCSFCPNLNQVHWYEGKFCGIFLGEGMCWHFSTSIGFCNGAKHMGPCWMLVYFILYILLSPCLLITLYIVLRAIGCVLNGNLNALGLVLLIETKWKTI